MLCLAAKARDRAPGPTLTAAVLLIGEISRLTPLSSASFASWQLPDEIRFVDEIARTSVGKINKKKLRAEYEDAYAETS